MYYLILNKSNFIQLKKYNVLSHIKCSKLKRIINTQVEVEIN